MIKPGEDRVSYGKILTPPLDYKLDFAIGTTYSLDLNALIGVPISLALSEEINDEFIQNPIVLLEGIRRASDKFIIFNEAGQIKVPKVKNNIYSLMESGVNQVSLPNNKSFHPKLWLIKYISDINEPIYRVIVLSRNLTFDRSWDMVVSLEGTENKKRTRKNDGIQDMLRFLLQYTTSEEKKGKIKEIIEELYYVHFQTNDNYYTDFNFYSFGVTKKSKEISDLIGDYNELLVISPFLSYKTLRDLYTKKGKKTLITRRKELEKLDSQTIIDFATYVMKEDVVIGEKYLSESEETDFKNQDIHAKFYGKSEGSNNTFFIGSANCSNNAFNGNVEFLIELQYKKRGFYISSFIEDLFGDKEDENPFERVFRIEQTTAAEEEPCDKIEKAIKRLCRSKIFAKVINNDGKYSLSITCDDIPSDVEFYISPLGSNKKAKLSKFVTIECLTISELGEFFKIEGRIKEDTLARVIKLPVEGIPANRDNEIFKSIISDKEAFFRYVAFMLSDNYLLEVLQQLEGKRAGWTKDNFSDNSIVIYENMLRTIAKEPEKIQELRAIIDIIDDDKIIPKEFNELYSVFEDVCKKVK
ncbi:MAG: phospholipase D family protein [Clostridium sp.]|nr:phospholipase D family protein [Clostridium sp.]